MSDLSITLEALERSRSQLSVSSYFDADLFQREQTRIFQSRPRYLGHELAIPELGNFYALPQEGEGRALVRTKNGVELISNVCRHRQAVMLRGRGNTQNNIVCPLHRWTYDLQGQLIGAPHFEQDPCLNLKNYPRSKLERIDFRGQRWRSSHNRFGPDGANCGLGLQWLCARSRQSPRMRLQLENLH